MNEYIFERIQKFESDANTYKCLFPCVFQFQDFSNLWERWSSIHKKALLASMPQGHKFSITAENNSDLFFQQFLLKRKRMSSVLHQKLKHISQDNKDVLSQYRQMMELYSENFLSALVELKEHLSMELLKAQQVSKATKAYTQFYTQTVR